MTLTVQFIDLDTAEVEIISLNFVQEVHPVINPKTQTLVGFSGITRNPQICRKKEFSIIGKPGCTLYTFDINCQN